MPPPFLMDSLRIVEKDILITTANLKRFSLSVGLKGVNTGMVRDIVLNLCDLAFFHVSSFLLVISHQIRHTASNLGTNKVELEKVVIEELSFGSIAHTLIKNPVFSVSTEDPLTVFVKMLQGVASIVDFGYKTANNFVILQEIYVGPLL